MVELSNCHFFADCEPYGGCVVVVVVVNWSSYVKFTFSLKFAKKNKKCAKILEMVLRKCNIKPFFNKGLYDGF